MGGVTGAFDVNTKLQEGIGMMRTDDWIVLTTFFNAARFKQPTTEPVMRSRLKMEPADPFKQEFKDTMALFQRLQQIGEKFETKVAPEVRALAGDIVQYQVSADTTYDRFFQLVDKLDFGDADAQAKLDELVRLWSEGKIEGRSDQIRVRIAGIMKTLAEEASQKGKRANDLKQSILDGILVDIQKCQADFELNSGDYEGKFGTESAEMMRLRTQWAQAQTDLALLRKKESDEVIVLSTSPVYLAVPIFGPFILAGVDVGVGVDLAKVRASIASKIAEADALDKQANHSQRFMGYFTTGKEMTTEIAQRIGGILPSLTTLGRGWESIAADISAIATKLDTTGQAQIQKEDWFNLTTTILTAQKMWKQIALRAESIRNTAEPQAATDIDDMVNKAMPKKAA